MAEITEERIRDIQKEEVNKALAVDIHKIVEGVFRLQKGRTNRED